MVEVGTGTLLRTWDIDFWGQPYAFEQPFTKPCSSAFSPSKQTAGVTPSTTGHTASMMVGTAAPPHCPPGR